MLLRLSLLTVAALAASVYGEEGKATAPSLTSTVNVEDLNENPLPPPVPVEEVPATTTTDEETTEAETEEAAVVEPLNLTETEEHYSKMTAFPVYDSDVDFTTWLSTSGVKSHPNLAKGGGPSSYVATEKISTSDPLLSIPVDTIMSATSATAGRVGIIAQVNPTLPEIITLTLHLMEEKLLGNKSTYGPFISTLPDVVESPLFFNHDEMAAINGSQLYRLIESRREAIDFYYESLLEPVTSNALDPPLFTLEEFTKEYFTWAIATVWGNVKLVRTKSTSAEANNSTKVEAMLIPMLHTIDENFDSVSVTDNKLAMSDDGTSIIVFSSEDYDAQDVIRVSIGTEFYDAPLFFLNHGVIPDTIIEKSGSLAVTVSLDPEDPVYSLKQLLHEVNNMTMTMPYTLRLGQTTLDPMVMFSMRIKLLSSDELGKYALPLRGEAVGIRNEYVFLRALLQTTQATLDALPVEDKDATTYSPMLKEAMKLVEMDKTILLQTKEWILKTWLDYLMGPGLLD